MRKRMFYGHLTVLFAAVIGIGGTFLLDYLEPMTKHPERLEVIFGIVGAICGCASFAVAIMFYTNNLGEGFKNKD